MRCEYAGFSFGYGAGQWVSVSIDYQRSEIEFRGSEVPNNHPKMKFGDVWDGGAPPPTRNVARSLVQQVLHKIGKGKARP